MSGTLEKRIDGSYTLSIENDLQFDSRDEAIYHESLALPALALALGRKREGLQQGRQEGLKVLIVGGGDGFIAREVYKSDRIDSVDLVDYDAEIVEYGRRDLAPLNQSSFSQASLTVHICDAWNYLDELSDSGRLFDLIICDLTVPQNLDGCRFHTVDWYQKLRRVVTEQGIIAINSCSPQATPRAYCSILNSIAKAGFHARPCHVSIPSFSQMGYGADWGFFVASPTPIDIKEFEPNFAQITPRAWLRDLTDLHRLFALPKTQFEHQPTARPALVGSSILLHYFQYDQELPFDLFGQPELDAFELNTSTMILPEPDAENAVPTALTGTALSRALPLGKEASEGAGLDAGTVLNGVIELMPGLSRERSFEVVETFLQNPKTFLQDLDLRALINTLLARASELPSALVAELESLRDRLADWAGDNLTVLSLGHRLLVILSLVIVLGNLLYPDMVYAKGHNSASGHAATAGRGTAGRTGRRGYGYGYGGWNGGTWTNNRTIYQRNIKKGPIGPGPSAGPHAPAQIKNYPPEGYVTPENTVASASQSYTISGPNPFTNVNAGNQTSSTTSTDLMRRHRRATAQKLELSEHLNQLQIELAEWQSSQQPTVLFGTHNISREDAVSRTAVLISKTQSEIDMLNDQLNQIASDLKGFGTDKPSEDELRS